MWGVLSTQPTNHMMRFGLTVFGVVGYVVWCERERCVLGVYGLYLLGVCTTEFWCVRLTGRGCAISVLCWVAQHGLVSCHTQGAHSERSDNDCWPLPVLWLDLHFSLCFFAKSGAGQIRDLSGIKPCKHSVGALLLTAGL